jgi:hypothetical protein
MSIERERERKKVRIHNNQKIINIISCVRRRIKRRKNVVARLTCQL